MVRRAGGDLFVEFLALLANKQLCRDTDTEVSCVINFSSVCVISVHRMLRVLLLLLPSSRHNFPHPTLHKPSQLCQVVEVVVVVLVLWWWCCGGAVVAVVLWWWCCGGGAVMVVLWCW